MHQSSRDLVIILRFLVSSTGPEPSATLLSMHVANLQLAALAPASRRSYTACWNKWSEWCHKNHHSAKLPRSPGLQSGQLFEFAQHLFHHPTTPNNGRSILSKISSINWCHRAFFGYAVGLSPSHRIALDGMARSRTPASRSQPVNPAILRSFYRTTTRTTQRDHAVWGSMVLAFFFCLRASEYASTPAKTNHYIRCQDVSFTNDQGSSARSLKEARAVHLFFRSSKGDREKRGCTRNLHRSGHPSCCPVIAAWRLREIGEHLGLSPLDPFCSYPLARKSHCQVSVSVISNAVKQAASAHGLSPADFSSHSLRSGGATEMFLGGCSDTTVQLFGRWGSDAYKAYIRIDRNRNMQIASRMMSMLRNSHQS